MPATRRIERDRTSRPGAFFALEAQELLARGAARQAVELCKRGLTHHPGNPTGYAVLALAYMALDEKERALNVLRDGYRRTGAQRLNELATELSGEHQPESATTIPVAPIPEPVAETTSEIVPDPLVETAPEPETEPVLETVSEIVPEPALETARESVEETETDTISEVEPDSSGIQEHPQEISDTDTVAETPEAVAGIEDTPEVPENETPAITSPVLPDEEAAADIEEDHGLLAAAHDSPETPVAQQEGIDDVLPVDDEEVPGEIAPVTEDELSNGGRIEIAEEDVIDQIPPASPEPVIAEPVIAEPEAIAEQSHSIEESAAAPESVTAGEPVATQEHEAGNEPAAHEKPIASNEPTAVIEEPAPATPPNRDHAPQAHDTARTLQMPLRAIENRTAGEHEHHRPAASHDRGRPLALHLGKNITRLRSSNLRLIPGLEFAPLRHEDQLHRQSIAPLINEPMPMPESGAGSRRKLEETMMPPLPALGDAIRERETLQPEKPESKAPAKEITRPPAVTHLPLPEPPREPEPAPAETTIATLEKPAPEERKTQEELGTNILKMVQAGRIEAELTPLEELARRLENARIPAVQEVEQRTSYEPSIVSETLANILVAQGAYVEALKAFQTLARQKPERFDYYQQRIKEMKWRIQHPNRPWPSE